MGLPSLLFAAMLMATVTGCALSSKSKRPRVVVVPDSRVVHVIKDRTDTGELIGWYVISPGHWEELSNDLAESDEGLAECLCLLRGENPSECDAVAPNIPVNPRPAIPH